MLPTGPLCGIYTYDKENDKSTDATNFGGGRPIPYDSTKISLVSIFSGINFIDTWINVLAKIFLWRCCVYQDKTKEIFKQIHTEIPTPSREYFKIKCCTLLNDDGGDWFINNMHNPEPLQKKQGLSKKTQQ